MDDQQNINYLKKQRAQAYQDAQAILSVEGRSGSYWKFMKTVKALGQKIAQLQNDKESREKASDDYNQWAVSYEDYTGSYSYRYFATKQQAEQFASEQKDAHVYQKQPKAQVFNRLKL